MTRMPPALIDPRMGAILPLRKATPTAEWAPTRPMGGWLIVYGLLKADGSVQVLSDRDNQRFQAAGRRDGIDTSAYLAEGVWNDTHRSGTLVGVPTSLEFHGADSPLAKAHGKVGWWTDGYLLDRKDPESWKRRGLRPGPADLQRADHFWSAAHMLKGTPRPLGLSAEGKMALSADGADITWARVTDAAVCEVPVNPGTTVEPVDLLKAVNADSASFRPVVEEDLEGHNNASVRDGKMPQQHDDADVIEAKADQIARRLVESKGVSLKEARRWINLYLRKLRQTHSRRT